jgi:hypothetical protein
MTLTEALPGLIIGGLLLAALSMLFGKLIGISETRNKAINWGAGRWRIDPKSGKRRFVFLNYAQAFGWVEDMNRGARKPVDVEDMMNDELK